jgi:N-acetylmuramoyl-L-alanine amidase
MKCCLILALALLALAGCNKQRQSARPSTTAPAITAQESSPQPRPSPAPQIGVAALRQSTAVLEKLTVTSSDRFPDAVLSRAKCLVVLPNVAGRRDGRSTGTAACRNGNDWSNPAFVDFTGATTLGRPGSPPANSDLLIFMMSNRAEEALVHGSVNFASDISATAGSVDKEHAIVADVEMKASDALAYLHSSGKLQGVAVKSGTARLNTELSRQTFGRSVTATAILAGSVPRKSATEPFNVMINSVFSLIRPAGIVIHHSVLVPDVDNAEQELDKFHSRRGFSVYCFGRVYHVAYHYLIMPDGTVEAGRPEGCRGAHSRGYNSYLGIALVGDFSSADNPRGKKGQMVPSEAQLRSLLQVTRRLRERYDIPLHRIVRHSDISRTYCPGDRFLFTRFLADLQKSTAHGF